MGLSRLDAELPRAKHLTIRGARFKQQMKATRLRQGERTGVELGRKSVREAEGHKSHRRKVRKEKDVRKVWRGTG